MIYKFPLKNSDFRPADDSGIPVPSRHLVLQYLAQEGAPVSLPRALYRAISISRIGHPVAPSTAGSIG